MCCRVIGFQRRDVPYVSPAAANDVQQAANPNRCQVLARAG